MTGPRIQAAIIDLDGTLLDTIPDLAVAANAMRFDLDMAPLPLSMIQTYVGKGADVLVERALTASMDARPDPDLFERGRASFLTHYAAANGASSIPYAGVVEGLVAMRAQGLRLACVTNKPAEFVTPLLLHTGLDHYFEQVIAGDTLARKKPDPMQLLHAARQFGLPPSAVVAIGDSQNDTIAAHAAGMRMLVVPYGYNEGQPIEQLRADAIVATLMAAAQWIADVNAQYPLPQGH